MDIRTRKPGRLDKSSNKNTTCKIIYVLSIFILFIEIKYLFHDIVLVVYALLG